MDSSTCKYYIDPKDLKTSRRNSDDLGKGSYGKVKRVYSKKYGISAAKICMVTGTPDSRKKTLKSVQREADSLLIANHENVARFQGVSSWSNYFAIIMDYAPFGNLHHLLENVTDVKVIRFKLRYRMAYEVTKALVFLHNCGIDDRMVHGDLKPSNILLNEDLRVRVADFGSAHIATCTTTDEEHANHFYEWTVAFAAPEMLADPFGKRRTAMDVFSFGRILYELITRKYPFHCRGRNRNAMDQLCNAIVEGTVEPDESIIPSIRSSLEADSDADLPLLGQLVLMMGRCCNRDSSQRPSACTLQEEMKEQMDQLSSVDLSRSVTEVIDQMPKPASESSVADRMVLSDYR